MNVVDSNVIAFYTTLEISYYGPTEKVEADPSDCAV
jgi:hypothetical protein